MVRATFLDQPRHCPPRLTPSPPRKTSAWSKNRPTSEFSNDLKLQVNQNQWSSRVAKAKGLATQLRSESIGQIGFLIRASPEKLVGSALRGRARTARGWRRGSKSKSHRAMLSIRAREGTQGVVTRSFSVRLRSALGRGGTHESVAFRSRISARSGGR